MATQTLYNPRTQETRTVPTGPEAVKLIGQGWVAPISAGKETVVKVTTPRPYAPAAVTHTAPVTTPPLNALQPYRSNGQIDLIKVVNSDDQAAISQAENVFGYETMKEARHLAKTPVTTDIYMKLGPATKKKARIVTPVSLAEYNRMSEREKADYYIEAEGVGSGTYAKLGPATKRYFHPALSTWEKATPWKEEEGQTATTKRILLWEAEIAVPFVHVARNWSELNNWQKGLEILLDATIISAIAARPMVSALRSASRATLNKTYGKTGGNVIAGELAALDMAATAGNRAEVINSGLRLQSVGNQMVDAGVDSGKLLIKHGQKVEKQAAQIAEHTINLAPQGRKVTKALKRFAKDQRGSIGDEFKFPIPDDELLKSGLTREELFEILEKVGDDPILFRGEILTRQRIKAGIWKKIEDGKELAEETLKEKKYLTPEEAGLQRAAVKPKPKAPVKTAVIEKLDQEVIEQIEKILAKAPVKPNVKHAIAHKIAQQHRKQARIIAKIAAEVAEKKRLQSRLRRIVRQILQASTRAGLKAAVAAKTQTQVRTAVKTATRTQTRALPATQFRTLVMTAPMTKTLTETATKTATATQTLIATKTATLTVTEVKRKLTIAPHTDTLTDIVPVPPAPTPTPTQRKTPPKGPPPPTKPTRRPPPRKPSSKRNGYKVVKVSKVPNKAGEVSFNSGIVKVTIDPPYRTADISYKRLRKPQKGTGSQEATLRVKDGDAPATMVLSRGFDRLVISDGVRMAHGPNVLIRGSKAIRQRRGTVI